MKRRYERPSAYIEEFTPNVHRMSMWRLAEIAERCICLDVMLVVDILEQCG